MMWGQFWQHLKAGKVWHGNKRFFYNVKGLSRLCQNFILIDQSLSHSDITQWITPYRISFFCAFMMWKVIIKIRRDSFQHSIAYQLIRYCLKSSCSLIEIDTKCFSSLLITSSVYELTTMSRSEKIDFFSLHSHFFLHNHFSLQRTILCWPNDAQDAF